MPKSCLYICLDSFPFNPAGDVFRHPQNPCIICECCEGGVYTCVRKECPKQECGILKQTKIVGDGCCPQCCDECVNTTCPQLSCPYQAYRPNQCCKTCGCNYNGTIVPMGKSIFRLICRTNTIRP